jgi:hypothetical protein
MLRPPREPSESRPESHTAVQARQNKALDPSALAGCPQASLDPSIVLAGQRRYCQQGDCDWGRAAVSDQYDLNWFQKRAQFLGYNDVFDAKKSAIRITHGQSEKALHRWAGLASDA